MELIRGIKSCEAGTKELPLFNETNFPKGKIMQLSIAHFKPNQGCPVHQHYDLHEIFIIDKGEIDITVDETTYHMKASDSIIIRPGHDHSLMNNTEILCEIYIIGIACPKKE